MRETQIIQMHQAQFESGAPRCDWHQVQVPKLGASQMVLLGLAMSGVGHVALRATSPGCSQFFIVLGTTVWVEHDLVLEFYSYSYRI